MLQKLEMYKEVDIAKFNTTTQNQIEQFNTAIESNRLEFNAKNEVAVLNLMLNGEQINTADTTATNAATEIAAKQAFDLTAQAQANLWQDMKTKQGIYTIEHYKTKILLLN